MGRRRLWGDGSVTEAVPPSQEVPESAPGAGEVFRRHGTLPPASPTITLMLVQPQVLCLVSRIIGTDL